MTTLPAIKPAAGTLAQQDLPVPPQLTATRQVPGFRNPQWVAEPLNEIETAKVRGALAVLEARTAPAHPKAILKMIFDLSIPHKASHTAAEWESMAHDFVEDLAEFSEQQIAEAIREYRRSKPFFPKSAELIAICQGKSGSDRLLARRARVLLGLEPPRYWEVPPPPATPPSEWAVIDLKQAKRALSWANQRLVDEITKPDDDASGQPNRAVF